MATPINLVEPLEWHEYRDKTGQSCQEVHYYFLESSRWCLARITMTSNGSFVVETWTHSHTPWERDGPEFSDLDEAKRYAEVSVRLTPKFNGRPE